MARLFRRRVSLTLARPLGTGEGSYFTQESNATTITDLRVTFKAEKSLGETPNTCTVTVYNLSESARAELQRKPIHVRLDAGYEDDLSRLFTGDMRWSKSTREGVDWATEIQLGDGHRAFKHARRTRTFKAGTDARTVVRDLADSMGLKLPTNVEEARELSATFAKGLTVSGPSHREVSRILGAHGFDWSIQDGSMQALRAGDVRSDQVVIISQASGMIGSPSFDAPALPTKSAATSTRESTKYAGPTLNVTTLLYPGLLPGGRIKVESREINGIFKVAKVVHSGDTHGQEWSTAIEARPV